MHLCFSSHWCLHYFWWWLLHRVISSWMSTLIIFCRITCANAYSSTAGSSGSSTNGLSPGAIIGIVVGIAVGVALIVGAILYFAVSVGWNFEVSQFDIRHLDLVRLFNLISFSLSFLIRYSSFWFLWCTIRIVRIDLFLTWLFSNLSNWRIVCILLKGIWYSVVRNTSIVVFNFCLMMRIGWIKLCFLTIVNFILGMNG